MFHCGPVASSAKHAVNMTFCGPARDTVLTNRQTEKLNFDTNYITLIVGWGWVISRILKAEVCTEAVGWGQITQTDALIIIDIN
jgi:hypothetical protein